MIAAIQEGIKLFTERKEITLQRIVSDFHHTLVDAEAWLLSCQYAPDCRVSRSSAERSVQILKQVRLVPEGFSAQQLWESSSENDEASLIQRLDD